MGYAETILQAVRAWHIAACGYASDHVIPAGGKGARPSLPYLSVRLGPATGGGFDERREHANGRRIYAVRRVTVAVQAYGKASHDLADVLEQPVLALVDPTIAAALSAAGISIVDNGGVTPIPTMLDTEIEERYMREYVIAFALAGTAPIAVEFAEAEIATTFTGSDADDPLVETITVT